MNNTLADGIHMTNGSKRINILAPVLTDTSDDAVAVVSYQSNGDWCSNINIISPTIRRSGASGVAVHGGKHVTITGGVIEETRHSGIILDYGGTYAVRTVEDVVVTGVNINLPNTYTDPVYGAPVASGSGVLIVSGSGTPSSVSGVIINGITVRDARADSIKTNGSRITVTGSQTINGAFGFRSDYGADISWVNNDVFSPTNSGMIMAAAITGVVKVSGNTVIEANTSQTAGVSGINILAASSVGMVDANVIRDASAHLQYGVTVPATGVIVGNNHTNGRPISQPAVLSDMRLSSNVRIEGKFGLGVAGPSSKKTSVVASDATTTQTLVNLLRQELIDRGFIS